MLRVSLTWVVEQFESIHKLSELNSQSKGHNVWEPIAEAKDCLRNMVANSVYSPFLKVSFTRASELLDLLLTHVPDEDKVDEELMIDDIEIWFINHRRMQFESVFRAELATIPIFLITQKGPYDIERLIDKGTALFPKELSSKVPEAEQDALETGKCLAFERSTACGFHTFRVVESVLRRYWDITTNQKPRPVTPTLGIIIHELEKLGCGEAKVLESLRQLTKLHRNPISHPDAFLTMDEAQATIGMANSVVTHMLAVLPDVLTSSNQQLSLTVK